MSHVHVKINFSFGIDSWNRCLSVHKRLQIWALYVFLTVGKNGHSEYEHIRRKTFKKLHILEKYVKFKAFYSIKSTVQ